MKLKTEYRRIYAIPDVHGRADLLSLAISFLKKNGYSSDLDLLVFTGDLIDRGPDSKGVLDIIKDLRSENPNSVVALRGNHEDMDLDAYTKRNNYHAKALWHMNGGVQTEQSYNEKEMAQDHIDLIKSFPYSLEIQGFFFSHAPVPREKDWSFQKDRKYSVDDLTWNYFGKEEEGRDGDIFNHEGPLSLNGKGDINLIGICGHIHRGPAGCSVRIFKKYRMLDCGCGCFDFSPLAIHECISSKTYYIKKNKRNKYEFKAD
jgi:serine/threonine protein phosphatase 1